MVETSKGKGKHINHRKPRTIKGGNSHKWLRHNSVFTSKSSTLLHV